MAGNLLLYLAEKGRALELSEAFLKSACADVAGYNYSKVKN